MATAELKVDVEFFEELYDGADGWLTLWRPRKTAWWELPDMPQACEPNQYFGVCPRAEKLDGFERGDKSHILSVPCLWVDFDCDSEQKKKRHPSRELAEHIISELPIRPSTVVWSGGGFHLYWLLHEPEEPGKASRVLESWQRWIGQKPLRDYDLDSTFDLPRVLRVPGSTNTRYGEPRRVEVVERNGRRYSLDDFEQFVTELNEQVKSKREYKVADDLDVSESINPPIEKLEALLANSPEFKRVWLHKRDLPSASEYDMSLANYAAQALWSDQEIAALLVVHRRKHYPESLKKVTERLDYVARTIATARGDTNYDTSIRSLNGALDESTEPERAPEGAAPINTRQGTLDRLSCVFGVQVSRWIQYGDENAMYYLELSDGRRIRVGGAGAVITSDAVMRRVIYEATRVVMKKVKPQAWQGVTEALASIVEIEQQEEAGHIEGVRSLLETYLQRREVYHEDCRAIAVAGKMPFTDAGFVHLNMEDFRSWCGIVTRDKLSRSEVLTALQILGWESVRVHARPAPRARYWRTPLTDELYETIGIGQDGEDW